MTANKHRDQKKRSQSCRKYQYLRMKSLFEGLGVIIPGQSAGRHYAVVEGNRSSN